MKTIYIKQNNDPNLPALIEKTREAKVISIDTETTGLDPLADKLRLIQIGISRDLVYILDVQKEAFDLTFLKDAFADRTKVKILQNAKFDIKFLMSIGFKKFKSMFDTLLASQLISCGDKETRHSLGVLAKSFLKIDIDKTLQKSDFSGDLSEEQLKYAALDAAILFDLREKQLEFLSSLGLNRVAFLEFNAVEAVASMEYRGFYLNAERWQNRINRQKSELEARKAALLNHFKSVFPISIFGDIDLDVDSPTKMLVALQKLGVPAESTMEHVLTPFKEDYPVIQDLFKYREITTALKMYGQEYLSFIHPSDGRIHADFKQIGTPTGRFTCYKPNLQQVPRDGVYRDDFMAQDGNVLIVSDYSAIEMRIMAQFSRDKQLLTAFNEEIDLHQYTGAKTFGRPLEDAAKGTELRQLGKGLNFATTYGAGPARFAETSGLTLEKSEEALKLYWNLYGGLNVYLQEAGKRAVEELESHSFSGRTWRFDVDHDDQKAVGQVERLGRNHPIQGTCSDILKRAIFLLQERLPDSAGVVNVIHDEIVVECKKEDSEETQKLVEATMVEAGEEVISLIPVKVDSEVTQTWKK